MEMLRLENPVYWKIGWTQHGNAKVVSQVSLDSKKEVIGAFFALIPCRFSAHVRDGAGYFRSSATTARSTPAQQFSRQAWMAESTPRQLINDCASSDW